MAAATYPLSIITPAGRLFEGPAESLAAPAAEGMIGILAGHAPLVTVVTRGAMTVRTPDGKEHHFAVDAGALEVNTEGRVMALLDHALETPTREEAASKSSGFSHEFE
ncbi:MAG: hypothetical protein Q8Q08_09305 [Candidatus Omnitrophota bacterium]|nr:hypothetical protein [Candidatus Omnitrophota bacterium]MDZ4243304.1 hypothetical protein [Candidatus Omnitrophota bacterium]